MRQCLVILLLTVGCGQRLGGVEDTSEPRGIVIDLPNNEVVFDANMHTPGYFRDTYRLLAAQSRLDDATAAHRLLIDLPTRVWERGAIPDMALRDVATLDALLILALRTVQATTEAPSAARQTGEGILHTTLGLDPARVAYNRDHDPDIEVTQGGAATVARAATWAIELVAVDLASCTEAVASSTWNPNEAEAVWVEEVCEPDEYVGQYCEPDYWVDGECYDVWVQDQCEDGYWRDNGFYEYRCYSPGDCRYFWVERWTYVYGDCYGGYWAEDCYGGHWEYGICYDGTWVPGECTGGYFEDHYPGGDWTFVAATTPAECSTVRPMQLAIAVSSAQVLHAKLLDDLSPEWRAALERLVESGKLQEPDEATLDAVQQILENSG